MAISYLPTFIPTKVLIVGCGGTGSRLVPLLAQFIKACPWVIDPEMTLIDDDIVEEKNLLRQNFIATDVGKYKAEVLAQRYSRAFNMKISACKDRVVAMPHPSNRVRPAASLGLRMPSQEQIEIFQRHGRNSIIVLCVDSPQARRDIITNMAYQQSGGSSVLVLDSGNENDFGQVSVSTWSKVYPLSPTSLRQLDSFPNSIPGDMQIPFIPADLSYFYDMVAADTLSCADLDQTMAINTMMANAMFGIIQNFYYSKPITYHRLDVTLSNGVTPQYMSPRWLKRMAQFKQPAASMDPTKPRVDPESNDGYRLQDAWIRSGELAASPCQTMIEISNQIDSFDKISWKPFKRLNDTAELAAKQAADEAERRKIAELRATIERETRALVKREMIAEAANVVQKVAMTKSGIVIPASVSEKIQLADTPWPFEKPEVVQMSPEAIKAIKAGLKEQEKLRDARFQARLQEVTQRESARRATSVVSSDGDESRYDVDFDSDD